MHLPTLPKETGININCVSAEVSGQYFGKFVVWKGHLLSALVSFISLKVLLLQ